MLSVLDEQKILAYNSVRNFCIYKMNNAASLVEKNIYEDFIQQIDEEMQKQGIEYYVFNIKERW